MKKGSPQKTDRGKYDPVRAACIEVLGMVFDRGWKSDNAITEIFKGTTFSDLDRRFLKQLCHGVIKMRQRLDYTYSFFLQKPNSNIDRLTKNILRLGLYQLIYTDRIPAGAAVSESVNLARAMTHQSRGAFVNAILRSYLRTPEKVVFPNREEYPVAYFSNFHSYPVWFVEYCLQEFGPDATDKFLARGNLSPQVTYRVNSLNYSSSQLEEILDQNQIEYKRGKYLNNYFGIRKHGLPLEKELIQTGRVYVQDESAGFAIKLLELEKKGDLLDLCSAPGGKATHAAMEMKNRGRITAIDSKVDRLEKVVENARRMGIMTIAPVVCNALDFKGPGSSQVLVDVPCSGWGVVGRHSDLRWSKSHNDTKKLAVLQGQLIRHAADLVLPGGKLVYSTCTIMREENDQIIEEFLLDRPEFKIDPPTNILPAELISERGFVKTYPNPDNMDGAFCVRLKKTLGVAQKLS